MGVHIGLDGLLYINFISVKFGIVLVLFKYVSADSS